MTFSFRFLAIFTILIVALSTASTVYVMRKTNAETIERLERENATLTFTRDNCIAKLVNGI